MWKRSRNPAMLALAVVALLACEDGERPRAEAEPAQEPPLAQALDSSLAAFVPEGSSFAEAERGRALFDVCTVCHATDGSGTRLGPSLTDGEWLHVEPDVAAIAGLIRAGVPSPREYPIPMPPHGGGAFDDEELRALATYVYVLGRQGGAV